MNGEKQTKKMKITISKLTLKQLDTLIEKCEKIISINYRVTSQNYSSYITMSNHELKKIENQNTLTTRIIFDRKVYWIRQNLSFSNDQVYYLFEIESDNNTDYKLDLAFILNILSLATKKKKIILKKRKDIFQ
ncbi:hypothetical protein [Petrocella sp. FN5]|uniref:hypothetical protein n=1 Tax=Petrocella sp. FN5 TaxID=3032002 RepID=UPI0023D9B8BB|nr:hypothetical protein [Petrocella sp. FN5]MDF1617326.1 hypothetical protein [Petrocella sp. FN5]